MHLQDLDNSTKLYGKTDEAAHEKRTKITLDNFSCHGMYGP